MKHSTPKPLTLDDVNFKTRMKAYWEEDIIKLAKNVELDSQKEHRLSHSLCKKCHYISTIAGQSFTAYSCAICFCEGSHHNTSVPLLCLPCATLHKLCADCGCSLDGKERKQIKGIC